MADVTVKDFDDLDNYEGMFLYAAKGLGVTAWGMSIERLPAQKRRVVPGDNGVTMLVIGGTPGDFGIDPTRSPLARVSTVRA